MAGFRFKQPDRGGLPLTWERRAPARPRTPREQDGMTSGGVTLFPKQPNSEGVWRLTEDSQPYHRA